MSDFTKKDAQEIRAILEAAGFEGEKLNSLADKLTGTFASLREEMESAARLVAQTREEWEKSEAPLARIKVAEEARLKTLEMMQGRVNKYVAETQVHAAELEALHKGSEKSDRANLERQRKVLDGLFEQIQALEMKKEQQGFLNDEQAKSLKIAEDLFRVSYGDLNNLTQEMMARKNTLDLVQRKANATKDLANTIENISPLSATGFKDSLLGTVSDIGSFSGALNVVGEQLKMQVSPANLLGSSFSYIVESTAYMVQATDRAQASFFKATGATREYDNVIRTVREDSAIMGVNIDDAAEAVTELYTGMAQFSRMTEGAQVELANFTAQMDQLGVSTATTVALLDSGTLALHMTAEEAMNMTKEVTAAAQALGIPVEKMNADLQAAMPQLAVYGDKAVDVFKNIAAMARTANIETSRLLDIAEGFDTFESAAEKVGRLNGVLGGNYLNSLEMVEMKEDERISTLLRGIEASGKSFKEMSRLEQKAVAASIGISDMAEANRLLGQSADAYDLMRMKADAGTLSQEEMQAAADRSRDVMEKLTNIMQSMAVAVGPLVDMVNFFAEVILKLDSVMGGNLAPILLTVAGLYTTHIMLTKAAALATVEQATADLASLQAKVLKAQAEKMGIATTTAATGATAANTTGTWISAAATAAWTTAKQFANTAQSQGLIVAGKELLVKGFNTAATWASVAATYALAIGKGVLSFAMGTATAVAATFGITLNAALFGIPALIGLIITGVVALIYYFDEAMEIVKGFYNFFIGGINKVIEGLNLIPMFGLEIPLIPMLAEGATNFTGTAIVGEAGPEIISTNNANVVSNENISRLVKSTESIVQTTSAGTAATPTEVQTTTNDLLKQLVSALTAPAGAAAAGGTGKGQDIVLVMDPAGTRVLAKAVGAQLDKTHNVFAKRS
jgi:hypothetical protein